jgi:hypothetical protein
MQKGTIKVFQERTKKEESIERRVSDRTLIGRVWGIAKNLKISDRKVIAMLAILQTDGEQDLFLNLRKANMEVLKANDILKNVLSYEEKLALAVGILEGIQTELESWN